VLKSVFTYNAIDVVKVYKACTVARTRSALYTDDVKRIRRAFIDFLSESAAYIIRKNMTIEVNTIVKHTCPNQKLYDIFSEIIIERIPIYGTLKTSFTTMISESAEIVVEIKIYKNESEAK
jgi:hypothetical protein